MLNENWPGQRFREPSAKAGMPASLNFSATATSSSQVLRADLLEQRLVVREADPVQGQGHEQFWPS